ncbi:MAG: hypothetical protein H5T72_10425 [Actinobacteria bacterium]|nr:hypothetical protein [Actinomycetota bacterium]
MFWKNISSPKKLLQFFQTVPAFLVLIITGSAPPNVREKVAFMTAVYRASDLTQKIDAKVAQNTKDAARTSTCHGLPLNKLASRFLHSSWTYTKEERKRSKSDASHGSPHIAALVPLIHASMPFPRSTADMAVKTENAVRYGLFERGAAVLRAWG